MAVANGTNSNKLMQEIYEEFLLCKICFEPYKSPKTLVCLHTFCALCLEKHQDAEIERSYRYLLFSRTVKCPICRKNTDLPTGGIKRLPDNFLVANLTDVISRKRNSGREPQCEICKTGAHATRVAVSKCLDCSKLMCSQCLDMHKKTKVTKTHSFIDAEVEKNIECKVHVDEVVRFYCEPCEICICVLCTFQEHKGHEVTSFTDGMHKYSSTLDSLVIMCREKINTVRDQLDLINRCESQLKDAEERIRDTATDSILSIRRREKEMLTHLYQTFGEEGLNFLKEKEPLQETLEGLMSTTNLTDIILKDKSIELLLLKREIETKLQVLLEKRMNRPPDVMMKPIPTFVPGKVAFGHLDNELNRRLSTEELHQLQRMCDALVQTEQAQGASNRISRDDDVMSMSIQTDTSCDSEQDLSHFPESPRTSASQFTMTLPLDVMERQTMTDSPAIMGRKVQTLPIPQATKETATISVETCDTSMTTIPPETQNEATSTVSVRTFDCITDTHDLIRLRSREMETDNPTMVNHGTYTEPIKYINRGCQKEKPECYDKITYTTKTPTKNRDVETDKIYTLNFGQMFRTKSQNVGTGTKTIVTMNTGVGEHVAQTCDQSVDTVWKGVITPMATKSTMHDIIYSNQSTETEQLGMRDSSTSPVHIQKNSHTVSTNTKHPRRRHVGTICHRDRRRMATATSQTSLSFNADICMPNLHPVTSSTNTDTFQVEAGDKRTLDEETYEMFLKKFRSNLVDSVTMTDHDLGRRNQSDGSTSTDFSIMENTLSSEKGPTNKMCDNSTDPVVPSSVSSATNTPTIRRRNRETETMVTDTRHCGTYTYVPMIEKATYMAQPIVISTGTSTPQKNTSNKKINTPIVELVNMSTNTPPASRSLEVPALFKTGSKSSTLCSRGTNTSTLRGMGPSAESGIMKAIVARHDVGVLKRPHTLSRGIGTPAIRRVEHATGMDIPSTKDAECSADLPAPSKAVLVDRESSPFRTPIIHRATSTISLHLVGRETSPIRFSMLSKSTSTPQLYTASSATCTDVVQTVDGESTPIRFPPTPTSVEVATLVQTEEDSLTPPPAAGMSQLQDEKTALATTARCLVKGEIERPVRESAPAVKLRKFVEGSEKPAAGLMHGQDSEMSNPFQTASETHAHHQGPEGLIPYQVSGTQGSLPTDINKQNGVVHSASSTTATGTDAISNSGSDMLVSSSGSSIACMTSSMNEKQTDTGDDPYSYQDMGPVTVTRGTCTRAYHMVNRDTSPLRFPGDQDKVRRVDKGIQVSKADLMEPQDKFHKAGSGKKSVLCTDEDEIYKPNLDAIKEDSCESARSSDDEHSKSGKASPILEIITSTGEEIKYISSSIVTHTEKLWVTATQAPPASISESTFTSDGKVSPTSILCTVETGTSTPPVPETEDKAVATESVAIDTKMAQCISKLKTVRQRLEQHPAPGPIYTKTQQEPLCTVTSSRERAAKVSSTTIAQRHSPSKGRDVRLRNSPHRNLNSRTVGTKGSPTRLTKPRDLCPKHSPTRLTKIRELASKKSPTRLKELEGQVSPTRSSASYSSTDSGPDSPTGTVTRCRKARKQRLDLSQMLRSTATANMEGPEYVATALPRPSRPTKLSMQSVHPAIIPKLDMNIKDYRNHSPGVKRRSRSRITTPTVTSIGDRPNLELLLESNSADELSEQDKLTKEVNVAQKESETKEEIRPEVKVSLSNKVDVNFLPREENIKRTEKPLVRKLPPQAPRLKEKTLVKFPERDPTKSHVDWHKKRILTRQSSSEEIGDWSSGCGPGGQPLQALIPVPPTTEVLTRPMISFNYHRSGGQLQVLVPEEGSDASRATSSAATTYRRASIDVAGISRESQLPGPLPRRMSLSNPSGISNSNQLNVAASREPDMAQIPESPTLLPRSLQKVKKSDESETNSQTNSDPDISSPSSDEQCKSFNASTSIPIPFPRKKMIGRRGSVA